MTWAQPVSDLRTILSDNSTDKLRYRKRVIDQPNGVNVRFKTFEFRRTTDFLTSIQPEGVFVNGVLVSVVDDFPEVGEFELATAPVDGDVVEATYYIQWFKDSELDLFLKMSSQWLGLGEDYLNVPPGLQPAALRYAAADAYQKLSLRWAEHLSETYRLQDAQDPKRSNIVEDYRRASLDARKEATTLRDHYYTRQGQSLQPLFANVPGVVFDPVPKR